MLLKSTVLHVQVTWVQHVRQLAGAELAAQAAEHSTAQHSTARRCYTAAQQHSARQRSPVSVCHQVSTMGHLPSPTTSWYQLQAWGLMGSPTVPSSLRLDLSWALTHSSPHCMSERMSVGAV